MGHFNMILYNTFIQSEQVVVFVYTIHPPSVSITSPNLLYYVYYEVDRFTFLKLFLNSNMVLEC